jgi:hypothetical protein
MEKGADKLREDGFTGDVKILTSCPSCLQGLSRYNDDSGTTADYIVVEIARHLLGENWLPDYVAQRQQRRHRAGAGMTRVAGCELCGLSAPTVVANDKFAVILVDDANYPGFAA